MSNFGVKSYWQVFEYKWEPMGIERRNGTILSKMINFQGQKVFRVGLRNEAHSSTLLFMTFELAKMGFEEYGCVFLTGPNHLRQRMNLEMEEDDFPERARSVQLYSAKFNDLMLGNLSFSFQMYIDSKVPNYHAERMDNLLGQQLWLAAVNQQGTDFELVAQERRFPVHKFIIAARIPILALHIVVVEANPGRDQWINLENASALEQFLKFIYTGELVGQVNHPLWQLASHYNVETLINLCREGLSHDDKLPDDLARLALILRASANNVPEIKPDAESDIIYQPDVFVLSLDWVIPAKSQKSFSLTYETSLISEGFGIEQSNEMFSAKITANYSRQQFDLFFLVHHAASKHCCKVQEVICCLDDGTRIHLEMANPTAGGSLIQMFTGARSFQETHRSRKHFPSKISFFLKLISTIPTYNYKLRDWLLPNHLWSAATVAKKMTDAEILVGPDPPTCFLAHRFIMSARSPVFAVMFASAFEEARTGIVRINDVNPDVFVHFFQFLYTGTLYIGDDRQLKKDLFALADRYQVETLINICRPAPEAPVDVEQLMDSFLSC